MSQSLATASAPTSARGLFARVWHDPDARSTSIGLLAVLLFHVLLWLVGPHVLSFDHIPVVPRPASTARDFNIELTPDTFAKQPPAPKAPPKFVETNPEAPENTPDNTTNFAAQNQQVAQEKPTPDGKSDRPAMEGKKDHESNQIVSGRLSKPIEHIEAIPPAPNEAQVAEAAQTPPKREQNPLSGTEKFEGENKEGIGANLAKRLENAQAVPEKVEGAKDAPVFDGPLFGQPAIDPKRPRPRPALEKTVQARPAVLAENRFGTSNVGVLGIDAKWSEYGQYLQRMIDTVQIEWERLLLSQFANPAVGSSVAVKFIMNNEGRVIEIGVDKTTANEPATRACVSAITNRMPYGPWSDDMRAVLGERQEMTFTFHYQ